MSSAIALCLLSASTIAEGTYEPYGVVLPGGVSIHGSEVNSGSYEYDNNEDLILFVTPSAQTSLLTTEVYNSATVWNNISSHVRVHIYFDAMPSKLPFKRTDATQVVGKKLDFQVLGQTCGYDETGDVSPNSDWLYSKIEMNTGSGIYYNASDKTTAAKMTFIHEVGHALKLAHPKSNSSLQGHTYNGYPYAVMNSGIPNSVGGEPQVAASPTWHDIECLEYKWGE